MRRSSSRLPATLELGLAAICFSLLISIPIGILSATKRNSIWDLVGTSFPLTRRLDPELLHRHHAHLALLAHLPHLLAGRVRPFKENAGQNLKHLILPMIALGTPSLAVNMRLMRSGLIDALGQEYTRVARAKGLTERTVVLRHALKNAFIPFVTVVGLQVGADPGRGVHHRDDFPLARRRAARGG